MPNRSDALSDSEHWFTASFLLGKGAGKRCLEFDGVSILSLCASSVCVCACVRACVRACVCVCVRE